MVIGVAMMSAMIPTIYGLNEASRGAQDSEQKRKDNIRKTPFHVESTCDLLAGEENERAQVHNARLYLGSDHKMYVTKRPSPSMTPFNGHFFKNPDFEDDNLAGLVTASNEQPPQVRWVYVDAQTRELKWGGREDREANLSGPFDLAPDDEESIILDGSFKWIAMRVSDSEPHMQEEGPDDEVVLGLWRVYYYGEDGLGLGKPVDKGKLAIVLRKTSVDF